MKRDPRLIEFSREHHQALKIGNALKKAEDAEAAKLILAENRAFLLEHFMDEERVLVPIIETLASPIKIRFYDDHETLRYYLNNIPSSLSQLQQLGNILIDHTRFEERELFNLIQNIWSKN